MEVQQPVSMALHILADRWNVVGWQLVLNYMQTPPTHYYLECSGKATYMKLTLSRPKYENMGVATLKIYIYCLIIWNVVTTLPC
jgi:hypothetical protein